MMDKTRQRFEELVSQSTPRPGDHPMTPEEAAIQHRKKMEALSKGMKEGRPPTSQAITEELGRNEVREILREAESTMSPEGQHIMRDTQRILDTAEQVLLEKSPEGEIQKALYHGGQISSELPEKSSEEQQLSKKDQEELTLLTRQMGEKLLNVSRLMVTSKEFRRLLGDINDLFMDFVRVDEDDDHHPRMKEDKEMTKEETERQTKETAKETIPKAAEKTTEHIKETMEHPKPTEKAKEKTEGMSQQMKERLRQKQLSPEERDKFIKRLKNLILETQSKTEYRRSVEDLISIASSLAQRTQHMQQKSTGSLQNQVYSTQNYQLAVENMKKALQRFANGRSVDEVNHSFGRLSNEIYSDQTVLSYIHDIKEHILKALREKEYVSSDEFDHHTRDFLRRGDEEITQKYRPKVYDLSHRINFFMEGFKQDRLTQQLVFDMQKFIKDIALDEQGRPTVKPELLGDFAKLIPLILQKIRYIPLPRIESSDEEYDFALDNMVIICERIVPSHIKIETTTHIDTNKETSRIPESGTALYFEIKKIEAEAHNAVFYYNKKSGFPKMSDAGYADVQILGDGIDVMGHLRSGNPHDMRRSTQILDVNSKVHALNLTVHESKRDMFYKIFSPIINTLLRKRVEEAISKSLADLLVGMDLALTDASKRGLESATSTTASFSKC